MNSIHTGDPNKDKIQRIDKIKKLQITPIPDSPYNYCCYSNEQEILFQRIFRKLYNNPSESDIILILFQKRFYTHSIILIQSKFFQRLFEKDKREKKEKKEYDISLEIKEEWKGHFEKILKYLYTGKLPYPKKGEELDFYLLCKKLDILEAYDLYAAYIATYFTPMDSIRLLSYAAKKKMYHLFEILVKLISKKITKVFKSDYIYKLDKENLKLIISSDTLCVDEIEVFNGVKKWCENYVKKINNGKLDQKMFLELFKEFEENIRLPLLSPHDIITIIEPLNIISKKYIFEAYKVNSLPPELLEKLYANNTRCKRRGSNSVKFKFDNVGLASNLVLHDNRTRVTTTGNSQPRTIFGDVIFKKKGIYFFEFSIIATLPTSYLMIGVGDPSIQKTKYFGNDHRGWALYCYAGNKYNRSSSASYSKKVISGMRVGVVLDFTDIKNGKIYYLINDHPYGEAHSGLTPPLSPAITMYSTLDNVKISKSPKLISNWRIRK